MLHQSGFGEVPYIPVFGHLQITFTIDFFPVSVPIPEAQLQILTFGIVFATFTFLVGAILIPLAFARNTLQLFQCLTIAL